MTTQMVRKQIYIQKRQAILLKQLSQARGVSEAEVIRQAIEHEAARETVQLAPSDHSAIDDFTHLAMSKRAEIINREPYHWNREDIYKI